MLTNREIYEIADKLGMIDHSDKNCCAIDKCEENHFETAADEFEMSTSKDLVSLMNFVEELLMYNDSNIIKNFLVAVLYNNNKDNNY